MKKLVLTFLFSGILQFLSAQTFESSAYFSSQDFKSRFDLKENLNVKSSKSANMSPDRLGIQSPVWEYTMMKGGYFSIGFNNGLLESEIDNNCQLSFGHPYSMASYPYVFIDGVRKDPFTFMNSTDVLLGISNDTLYHNFELADNVSAVFRIFLGSDKKLMLEYLIDNKDDKAHELSVGLLFDIELGRWGDGFVEINDQAITEPNLNIANSDSIYLFERETQPLGLGVLLETGDVKADNVQLDNWINLYQNTVSKFDLFDVGLNYQWNNKTINPSERLSCILNISEITTEVSGEAFMRWNLPNALSIENNMLFPLDLNTTVEIQGTSTSNNFQLQVSASPFVESNIQTYTAREGESLAVDYRNIELQFLENYDSLVASITLSMLQNGQVVDELRRNVFIPAAPFTNEGLEVTIDTLYSKDGKIIMTFRVINKNTQQILYELNQNNAFFRINGSRVDNFILEKDTSNGINEVDIVFILDVTGSMSNEIASVRDNIKEFSDSLERQGYNYQLGMVTFSDEIENVYEFTSNPEIFKQTVGLQRASGGGDYPENSLDALMRGTEYQFRTSAKRLFIWITDATYHEQDNVTSLSKQHVVDALLAKGIQTHCIGNSIEQLSYYDQIILNTGGNFYDINGNFRDILLDVSRFGQSPAFNIVFTSDQIEEMDEIEVEVHYSGLGGSDTIKYDGSENKSFKINQVKLDVYPVPITYKSLLTIENGLNYSVRLRLINLLGQVQYNKLIRGVNGKDQIALNEMYSILQKTNQAGFIKVDVLDSEDKLIETQTLKLIR